MILAAVLSAWVQYAADGKPHARALVTQTCPSVTYDGGSTPMRQRAGARSGFDDVVCDAPLPGGAANVTVDGTPLPSPPRAPQKIVVFGDTGCRMADQEQQNCGDIADWPFPKIAQTIAAVHPDLLVHVGDYYYRESNCLATLKYCVNRWGDTSMSWNADWFAPGKPLFASAPLVMIRGNHEDCARGGPAWFRYLDPGDSAAQCRPKSAPWAVAFDGLQIVVTDSAADPSDSKPDPLRIAYYTASFAKARDLAAAVSGDRWLVTHRPPYSNTNETRALRAVPGALAPFDAVLAGHVHDFEAINLTGYPALIVNGESGDDLDDAGSAAKYIRLQTGADKKPLYAFAAPAPYATKQFGFAVYTKTTPGWTISLRDADGIERRACALAKGIVSCP
jgi:calcineurin-like phosphoesterase family protein